jgi:GAF domain-containing protein
MPDLRPLTDQELIDASHRLRRSALSGSTRALGEARRHESELRRRFGQLDPVAPGDGWRPSASPPESATLAAAAERFIIATADAATQSAETLRDLLHNLRVLLDMDIAFVAEFVDGQKIYRDLDLADGSKVNVQTGAPAPLETTLCQRVVDGRLPPIARDARSMPEMAGLAAAKALDIGSYLSTPVVMRDGSVYGTLCCISHQPRSALGTRQLDSLRYVAAIVAAELEKRRG